MARIWNITPQGLSSKARTQSLTIPRQIAMHLVREVLNLQLIEIGKAFGGRDHSTVIHSLTRATELIHTNQDIAAKYKIARAQLGLH